MIFRHLIFIFFEEKTILNNKDIMTPEDDITIDVSTLADDAVVEDYVDVSFELSYSIFKKHFDEPLQSAAKLIDSKFFDPITCRSKTFQGYIEEFYKQHAELLSTRTDLVKEMFLLFHTCRALMRYNDFFLNISRNLFRSHFYFPNIIFLLTRYLPTARIFFQKNLKNAYSFLRSKYASTLFLYEKSMNYDVDVIKTDIFYQFLGNAMRKFNPLDVKHLNALYKKIFIVLFDWYFKSAIPMETRGFKDFEQMDVLNEYSLSTRDNLYKDVLVNLQIEKFKNDSPTMKQLHYNYNIFKNVVITNEFQSIFLSSIPERDAPIYCNLNNSQYKVLSIYDRITSDEYFFNELKQMPLIYKLLKSVHLITKNKSNMSFVRRDVLVSAITDELALPFKHIISTDTSLRNVLIKIAENFVDSIMQGEYISLHTLSPINLNQLSFTAQLKRFIRLCYMPLVKKKRKINI